MTIATYNSGHEQNKQHFEFYETGGVDGLRTASLSLTDSMPFYLEDVRLHLSVVHASVEDLAIRLSAINGSAFNQIFISQAMLNVKDYMWQPDRPILFNSGDHLVFSLFIKSAANIYGLSVRGWSVRG